MDKRQGFSRALPKLRHPSKAVLGLAWAVVILTLIAAGLAGTLAGRLVLNRISDLGFKRALNVILVLISLRLIWQGLVG